MAATYAALLAIARSLRGILDLENHVDPLHKEKIVSILEKVDFIVTFLEDYSEKHHGTLDFVRNGIRNAAYEAQDFMDSYLCWVSTTDHDDGSCSSEVNLDRDLTKASQRIDFIWRETMKKKKSDTAQDLLSLSYSSHVDSLSTVQTTDKNMVVGFDDDLIAIKEGFLHHHHHASSRTEFVENPFRRLALQTTKKNQEWEILDSRVRSILIFPKEYCMPRLHLRCRHICILDAPQVQLSNVSHVISASKNLRYFDFSLFHRGFPVSISKLANLETIVVRENEFVLELPYEILKIPKLRHLIFQRHVRLSYPSDVGIVHQSDVQTIETAISFVFSKEIVRVLVNLKTFKVVYYDLENRNWDDYNLDNLCNLRNLEDLEFTILSLHYPWMIWNHAFPISLKKLSLCGVPLAWENMTIIGSLPNLQVLEMMHIKLTKDYVWTTEEGQFLQLKYFRSSLDGLVKWETEKLHFPCLETLILDSAVLIDEIPSGIGDIDTLQYIELWHCMEPLVNSTKQILKHQHENGNDAFRVRVVDLFKDIDHCRKCFFNKTKYMKHDTDIVRVRF